VRGRDKGGWDDTKRSGILLSHARTASCLPCAVAAIKRKKDGPCGSRCVYCACPEDQRVCLPVKAPLWRKFTVYMRFLWMVDEVECRWNAFLRDQRPDAAVAALTSAVASTSGNRTSLRLPPLSKRAERPDVIEVSWSEDLSPHIERFAKLYGFRKLRVLGVNANRGDFHPATGKAAVHKSHVAKSQEGCVVIV